MTERLLLRLRAKGSMTRREVAVYIWRMQGQPNKSFLQERKKWTIFGLQTSRHFPTSMWWDHIKSLIYQGWIKKEGDVYRLGDAVTEIATPFYSRKPTEPAYSRFSVHPPSPPYDPADHENHYTETTTFWSGI